MLAMIPAGIGAPARGSSVQSVHGADGEPDNRPAAARTFPVESSSRAASASL
jgi:hypothetical protein